LDGVYKTLVFRVVKFIKLVVCLNVESSAVAYADNFHGGVSFSGMWWSFVCGVRSL